MTYSATTGIYINAGCDINVVQHSVMDVTVVMDTIFTADDCGDMQWSVNS